MVELRLDNDDEKVTIPTPYVKGEPGNLILPVGDVIMYGIKTNGMRWVRHNYGGLTKHIKTPLRKRVSRGT